MSPTDPESTVDLLQRARAGDRHALDLLFARYVPQLRRWASGRLPRWARDMTDTHDLVQEALLQTFRKIGTFEYRGEGALRAYLRQVLVNRIREELRKNARRPDGVGLDEGHPDSAPSPLENAIDREAFESYERALERLSEDDREAVIARVEMGLTYGELAAAMGKPTADAARKAARRAVLRLADEMNRG